MMSSASRPKPLSTAENTAWNLFGCLFYLSCQWLTTVIVVVLSDDYSNSGFLAFAMSIGNMFASLALYKIRTYQVSDIRDEYPSGVYVAFRFVTIAISFLILAAYLLILSPESETIAATLVFLFFKADETFVDVLYGIDQKYGRMDYVGKSQLIRGVATLVGFSIPLAITGSVPSAIAGMTILCFANTLLFDVRHARCLDSIAPQFNFKGAVGLAKACLMPTIANFCAISVVSIVRQFFGIAAGDDLLGIYASVATPAVLIQAGATFLYSPLIGKMATALHLKGNRAFLRTFVFIFLAITGVMILGTVTLSLVGDKILILVFGQSLAPYTWIFPFVLAGTTAIALLLYINDVLIILRDNRTQLAINAFALLIASLVSAPLIDSFGMNGINYSIFTAIVPSALIGFVRILNHCKQSREK